MRSSFAIFSNLSLRALLFAGKKPSKQNLSEAIPDAQSAVIAAHAPGKGTTRMPASRHWRTK